MLSKKIFCFNDTMETKYHCNPSYLQTAEESHHSRKAFIITRFLTLTEKLLVTVNH